MESPDILLINCMVGDDRRRDWDGVLSTLSETIQFKSRADANNWRDAFENMQVYMQRIGIEEDVKKKLSVIHVAGTKGKGSTCAMVESMLRNSGYKTGLFTSPHLMDVRERIRLNGEMVDKDTFQDHFWWCFDRFRDAATDEIGVPGYFRFMTLLALRIFIKAGIDVVVLEVGVGGRLDATNCVVPQVCGITSLGMDHMEMLGDTLPKIAREKAGILKAVCPGYTVYQPPDAMEALKDCARKAGTTLEVVPPVNTLEAKDGTPIAHKMALGGAHMLVNAGLAVKLASEWERLSMAGQLNGGSVARLQDLQQGHLPPEYALGLQEVDWPGRSQVLEDEEVGISCEDGSRLSFYIDGAHTPESMETCAAWFAEQSSSIKGDVRRVLLFNCMKERDPAVLLPTLSRSLASRGIAFHQALFVPPDSQYGFLPGNNSNQPSNGPPPSPAAAAAGPPPPDLIWQAGMQQLWEKQGLGALTPSTHHQLPNLPMPVLSTIIGSRVQDPWKGAVVPSLRPTLDWLRRSTPRGTHVQVLVTGSLYLVGDVLRLLGRAPK